MDGCGTQHSASCWRDEYDFVVLWVKMDITDEACIDERDEKRCKLGELDLFELKGMDSRDEKSKGKGKRGKERTAAEDHMQLRR